MKHSEKVLAFIGKWLNDVQTKPGGYAIAYDYKHNPQKLTFYRAYKSYNETMAESIFAPSWEAYLDDDVLEKEVTDALNKLKEKVDRWHVCEEDGYERRRTMKTEAWETFASDLYKKFKEKERKEMDIEFARREDNDVRLKMAKAAVVKWYNEYNQSYPIGIEDVYIVWFCKVLQNWKALAGTHHSDGMYYEVTFDGNNKLVYFDAYKKWQNVQMSGRELEKGVC